MRKALTYSSRSKSRAALACLVLLLLSLVMSACTSDNNLTVSSPAATTAGTTSTTGTSTSPATTTSTTTSTTTNSTGTTSATTSTGTTTRPATTAPATTPGRTTAPGTSAAASGSPTKAVISQGVPSYATGECIIKLPDNLKVGTDTECGLLTVPEDRSKPTGKTIKLPVVRVKATGNAGSNPPLLAVQGGPGGSVATVLEYFVSSTSATRVLRQDRDMIFMDQRGTPNAQPSLFCSEEKEATYADLNKIYTTDESIKRSLQLLNQCRDRLVKEGNNLAAYNSVENASDVADLVKVLSLSKVDFYGVSYGTRLGLTVMRDHPEILRSVILDATVPLEVDLIASTGVSFDRAFNEIFKACAADTKCNKAYPNLRDTFGKVYKDLNAKPASLSINDPEDGKAYETKLDGASFLSVMSQLAYSSEIIPAIPLLITQVSNNDFSIFGQILPYIVFNFDNSTGFYFSVQCSEEVAFTNAQAVQQATQNILPELKESDLPGTLSVFDICKNWPAKKADAKENQAVKSDIPTLITVGQLDPITPPSFSQIVAKDLSKAYLVEFPGLGHGAILNEACPTSVAQAFLKDPTKEPNSSCKANMKLTFLVR